MCFKYKCTMGFSDDNGMPLEGKLTGRDNEYQKRKKKGTHVYTHLHVYICTHIKVIHSLTYVVAYVMVSIKP